MSNNTVPNNNPMFVNISDQLRFSGTKYIQVNSESELLKQKSNFIHPEFVEILIEVSDRLQISESPINLVESEADKGASSAIIDLAKFYNDPLLNDFLSIVYIAPTEDSPGKLGNVSISHAIRMHQRSAMVAANLLRDKDPVEYDEYISKLNAQSNLKTRGNIYYLLVRNYPFAPNALNAIRSSIRTGLTSFFPKTGQQSGNSVENQFGLVAQLTGLNQNAEIYSKFPGDRIFVNLLIATMNKLGTDWIKAVPNYTDIPLNAVEQIEGGLEILNQLVTNKEG